MLEQNSPKVMHVLQVGNPITNDYHDYTGIMDYAWSHSVIPDQLYHKVKQVCDFKLFDWSIECGDAVNQVFDKYSEIDIYNIYAPKCLINSTSSSAVSKVNIYLAAFESAGTNFLI